MSFYSLKMRIKSISLISYIYEKFIGEKKVKRIEDNMRKALKTEGMSTIEKIEQILMQKEVKYFLDFGSLLGMIRNQKFMDYDNDIDYGIYINENFTWKDLEILLTQQGMKKIKQFTYKQEITEQTYKNNHLTIDFFGHWDDDKNSYTQVYFGKKDYPYIDSCTYHVSRLKMYKVEATKKMEVDGVLFNIPSEPERYLASIYTENWKIPDPNWISENGPAWNELKDEFAKVEYFS